MIQMCSLPLLCSSHAPVALNHDVLFAHDVGLLVVRHNLRLTHLFQGKDILRFLFLHKRDSAEGTTVFHFHCRGENQDGGFC